MDGRRGAPANPNPTSHQPPTTNHQPPATSHQPPSSPIVELTHTCHSRTWLAQLRRPSHVFGRLAVSGEPDLALGHRVDVCEQLLEGDDARSMTGNVWVHREDEHRAFLERLVEFVHPDAGNLTRRAVAVAQWTEKRSVVENPLDGNLHQSGRRTILEQFVRLLVGHQRALVAEAKVAQNA